MFPANFAFEAVAFIDIETLLDTAAALAGLGLDLENARLVYHDSATLAKRPAVIILLENMSRAFRQHPRCHPRETLLA